MRDVNDMWVKDNCQTVVHCRGYSFTINELFDIAQIYLPEWYLKEHEDHVE